MDREDFPVKFALFSIGLPECVGGLPDMSGRNQTKDRTSRATGQPGRTLSYHAKLADARKRRAALQAAVMEPANLPHAVEPKDIIPAEPVVVEDPGRRFLAPVRALALLLVVSAIAGIWLLKPDANGEDAAPVTALPEPDATPTPSPILAAIPFQRPVARPGGSDVTDPRAPGIVAEAEALPTTPQERIAATALTEQMASTMGRPAVLRPAELEVPARPGPGPAVLSKSAVAPDPGAIEERNPWSIIGGAIEAGPVQRPVVMPASVLADALPAVPDTLAPQPAAAIESPEPEPAATLVPVIFHTPARSAQDRIDTLRADALTAGFDLGDARRQPVRIRAANVRYYHPEDRDNAARLAAATGAELRDFTWFRPRPSTGTIELWAEGRSGVTRTEPERVGLLDGLRRDLSMMGRDIADLLRGNR
jgi:hypothetical protein